MDNQTSASSDSLYSPEQILFKQLTLIKAQLHKLLNQINQYNLNINATSAHCGLSYTPEEYIKQLKQLCIDNLSQFLGSAEKSSFFQTVYNVLEHYQKQEFQLQKQASQLNAVYQLHRDAFEQFSSTSQQTQASSFHILQMQAQYVGMPKQTTRLSPSYFENTPSKNNSIQFVENSGVTFIAEPSRYIEKPPQHSDEIYQAVIVALKKLIQKTTQVFDDVTSQFNGVHCWGALRLHNAAFKGVVKDIKTLVLSFELGFKKQYEELIGYLDSLHKQAMKRNTIQREYEERLRFFSDDLERCFKHQHGKETLDDNNENPSLHFKSPVVIGLTQKEKYPGRITIRSLLN